MDTPTNHFSRRPKNQSMETLTDLQGQIERISYSKEENGYTIAKLKVYGQRDLVTIVGNLMAPIPGEIIENLNEGIFLENNKAVYLAKFHVSENSIAIRMKALSHAPKSFREIDADIAIGTKRALAIAVRNNKTERRYTHLRARLSEPS